MIELAPPEEFLRIASTLESRGFQAWAVGGAVRDALRGESRADWDLATDARPEDVQRVFRRTVPLGVEHGTVGVLGESGTLYEVTTFRRDVETDGRHAVVEFAPDIREDLARRDFTINALAWRPETGELLDPFEGREDLDEGVLRAVGEPAERFAEDYLRVLRGLRFAGRLRLQLEPATWEALREAAGRLGRLSAERVREELMKVLADPAPSAALRLYREAGALEGWYPEQAAVAGDPFWEVNLAAVEALPRTRPLLRFARWLVPIAEEAEARAERGRDLMHRLKFSNAEIDRVSHLLVSYQPLVSPVDSSAQLREWLAEVSPAAARDVFRLHFADARATAAEEKVRYLVAAWRRVHAELLSHPPLTISELAVDGSDLLELGVPQGPLVGVLLDELHARVLEEPGLNRRDALLPIAEELVEMGELRTALRSRPEGTSGPGKREPADG